MASTGLSYWHHRGRWCSKERRQPPRKCSLSKCKFLLKIHKGKIIILYTGCSLIIFLVPFQTWSVPSTLGIASMPQGNLNQIGPNNQTTTLPNPLAMFRWTFRSILICHPIPFICGKGKSAVLKVQREVLTLVTSDPMALFKPPPHTALKNVRKSLRASLNSVLN